MPSHSRPSQPARASFRSIRLPASNALRRHLRQRHALWLHGWLIGLLTLAAMWSASVALRLAGLDWLALRYALCIGAGYAVYLLLLRCWAAWLLHQRRAADAPDPVTDLLDAATDASARSAGDDALAASGEDGDFAGGGASGSFDAEEGGVDALLDSAAEGIVDGVVDAGGAAEEGAVVLIPVLLIFALALVSFVGAGLLLLLLFGTDVLLAVAVELAFAWAAARTATRLQRQGWLAAAIRLSYKPLLAALISATLLGAASDYLAPGARTLPEAVRLLRSGSGRV